MNTKQTDEDKIYVYGTQAKQFCLPVLVFLVP